MNEFTCGIARTVYAAWVQRFLPDEVSLGKQIRDLDGRGQGNSEEAKVLKEKRKRLRENMKSTARAAVVAAEQYIGAARIEPEPDGAARVYGTAERLMAEAVQARIRELAELEEQAEAAIDAADVEQAALLGMSINAVKEKIKHAAEASYTAALLLHDTHLSRRDEV